MRFTVPFLLAIAVYVATVLGANQTSFNPNEDMLYDVVSASDAIGFRLERALGISEQLALLLGALLLTLPALLTFHLFRVGFGGSVQSLIQEDQVSRRLTQERERAHAARYATGRTASSAATSRARDGEVLTRARAGDSAESVNEDRRSGRERRDGSDRRRGGLGANIAAAIAGRGSASQSAKAESGSASRTSASETSQGSITGGIKDRWTGMLDKKPDLSRLKSGAQNLRERISTRSGSSSTKLSIDDLADDVTDK